MGRVFVPYSENGPHAIEIKGHRLLIISTDGDGMHAELRNLGSSEIRMIDLPDDEVVNTEFLASLAASVHGGVVVAPPGVSMRLMIESLEKELPWVH